MFALARTTSAAWPPPQGPGTSMARCVVLAALMHALLVAVLGNTPGGTARPGEGVWGPINVLLRGSSDGDGQSQPQPDAYSGPVGSAAQQRFGGAVRNEEQAPRSNDGPGANKQGTWSATLTEAATELTPSAPPPQVPLPMLEAGKSAPEAAATAAPARITSPTVQARSVPTPAPVAVQAPPQAIEAPTAPPVQPLAPPPSPSVAERVAPMTSEARPSDTPRAAPAESEAKLKMIDSAAVLPTPRTAPLQALERPSNAAPAPLSLPALADAPALPRAQLNAPVAVKAFSALPVAPIQPNATSSANASERALTDVLQRTEPAVLPTLADAPAAPRAQLDPAVQLKSLPALGAGTASPGSVPRQATTEALPNVSAPVATALPTTANVPNIAVPSLRATTAPVAPAPAGVNPVAGVNPSVSPGASPGANPSSTPGVTPSPHAFATPGSGAPDAGARAGRDVATPPSANASAPLNLNLARPRGGEVSRDGGRSVLNLLPHPPERKGKLEEGIEKSAKKDCRDAYSGFGLLAVIPLVANAVTEKCKW